MQKKGGGGVNLVSKTFLLIIIGEIDNSKFYLEKDN